MSLGYCGWEYCEPGHRFGPNQRRNYVLHVVREGRGTLEIGDSVYHLEKGHAFVLRPGAMAWFEADQKDPWCYLWVGFNGLKAEECIKNAGFSEETHVRKLKMECVDDLYRCLEQILAAHQLTFSNDLKRRGLLMLFFSRLIQDYQEYDSGSGEVSQYPVSVYVKSAIDYIAKNYSKKIRIKEMADYIGVNRSYLTTSFKRTVGCSPQEYLLNLRMEKAKGMLTETDIKINEVAVAVGYADQLAFSRIFRQHCGLSPREYRDREQKLLINTKKGDYSSPNI